MTKFAGKVAFAEEVERVPGVITKEITVRPYRGDVLKNSRTLDDGTKVNNDISVGNSISIVADAYARGHFFDLLYVEWQGVQWKADNVSVEPPRLVIRLGGRYNGSTT